MRTDLNTYELRLIVDFTSIITVKGKEDELFKMEPIVHMVDPKENHTVVAVTSNVNRRIFSAIQEKVPKGFVMKMTWKMNWSNIAKINTSYKKFFFNKSFIPILNPVN